MQIQLHWQFKDGTTKLQAQRVISCTAEMRSFVRETKKNHAIPENAIWMACNEESEHFVFTHDLLSPEQKNKTNRQTLKNITNDQNFLIQLLSSPQTLISTHNFYLILS